MIFYFWVAGRWSRDLDVDFQPCYSRVETDVDIRRMVNAVADFGEIDMFLCDGPSFRFNCSQEL
jgi:hypothetical protein